MFMIGRLSTWLGMNQHFEESGCSFQTLKGKSPIGYYALLPSVITFMFLYHGQSQRPCNSLETVGMTMACSKGPNDYNDSRC